MMAWAPATQPEKTVLFCSYGDALLDTLSQREQVVGTGPKDLQSYHRELEAVAEIVCFEQCEVLLPM